MSVAVKEYANLYVFSQNKLWLNIHGIQVLKIRLNTFSPVEKHQDILAMHLYSGLLKKKILIHSWQNPGCCRKGCWQCSRWHCSLMSESVSQHDDRRHYVLLELLHK
ncbi:zinc finger SWIM domain-containing protein 7 [Platysternon megacephalum]|uniref:Zinc finger SWIM domain-containing protein 7 n=1 Tax=Platysternon megacephalum TaxID=55544 RepID=A0A4D9F4Q8_9SAUR|nr:zinc finger SWIM domain-containing protein 7 [Platysternon megacephalum]